MPKWLLIQLTVSCQGYIEYSEDVPVVGTWWNVAELGQRGLIENAMALAAEWLSQDGYDLSSAIDALSFQPELVLVRGALDRLVLTGRGRQWRQHALVRTHCVGGGTRRLPKAK